MQTRTPRSRWKRSVTRAVILACMATTGLAVHGPSALARADAPATAPAQVPVPAVEVRSRVLAYRLADLAQLNLLVSSVGGTQYRQSAALLDAAARLQPEDSYFPRLAYEALIKAGDVDGAIARLVQYAKIEPADRFAQLRLVELYAQQQETADNRIRYLTAITQANPVPEEVRAHAAFLLAQTLLERGDRAGAIQQVNLSLKLNPLSPSALNLRYAQTADEMSPPQRLTTLLAMLRANPMQVEVLSAVARELADAGLGDESLPFYDGAVRLTLGLNAPADPSIVRDLANRLMQSGNGAAAETLLTQLLSFRPDDVAAHCIRLANQVSMSSASTQPSAGAVAADAAARVCLTNGINAFAARQGDASATTRPAEAAEPAPLADIVKLAGATAAAKDAAKIEELAGVLNDYGVYLSVFAGRAADLKPVIAALKALGTDVPNADVSVTRLEGWQYLLDGKPAEARVKLSAVSARDPLSALGLVVVLAGTDPAEAQTLARRLKAENPSGPLGAMLYARLRPLKVETVLSPVGEQVKAELAKFPAALLRFGEQPQAFYSVRAEPVKVAVDYASPLLAKVTIANISQVDLTIGPDGALRPDVVIDAVVKGPKPGVYAKTAFDTINNAIVLRPRQSTTRVVRVDQGRLASFLGQTPQFAVPIFPTLTTNPLPGGGAGGDQMVPGPGGVSVQFSTLFERQAVPCQSDSQRQKLMKLVASGPTDQRLSCVEALSIYSQLSAISKDEKGTKVIEDVLAPMAKDADVAVRAWATYLNALRVGTPDDRRAAALLMTSDSEWVVRIIGLAMVPALPVQDRAKVVTPLLNDPDPTVAALARAQSDELIEGEPPSLPRPGGTTAPAPVK